MVKLHNFYCAELFHQNVLNSQLALKRTSVWQNTSTFEKWSANHFNFSLRLVLSDRNTSPITGKCFNQLFYLWHIALQKGNCLCSIMWLIESMGDHQICFWLNVIGWVWSISIINQCHNVGDHTAIGEKTPVNIQIVILKDKIGEWCHLHDSNKLPVQLCNTITIYLLVCHTLSNGRLSTPIICPIYLSLCNVPCLLDLMWTQQDLS